MQPFTTLLAFTTLLTAATAQYVGLNTSQEFNIRTCLKPNQPGKERFDNLWLVGHHSGAGQSDAVFEPTRTNVTDAGYLTPANQTTASGEALYNQMFNLGNPFPWQLEMMYNTAPYGAWEPVRIQAGGLDKGDEAEGWVFLNSTGLQYSGSGSGFNGWLVCEWWLQMPQLFYRVGAGLYNESAPTPSSCADVYLMPEYI
ncbi:hypothetical protein LTR85_005370 [Meristemomyces frigidus]|nr:hypothetical protein LTR85_005370 [Meristemomyces frigidus]